MLFSHKLKFTNNLAKNKYTSGFTLVEAMVVVFIFSLITVTFYRTYTVGTKYIIDAKNRLGAISVANEKMEIIRNLKYENIGTESGAVSGNIPNEENVSENAGRYVAETTVEYVDDEMDDVYPTDNAPEDYKKVTVKVSWNNGAENVQLASRFVPIGREVPSPGDGILRINIFSDQPGGAGIPYSTVHVVNSDTGLNTTVQSDNIGSVTLMGDNIKNSIQKYQITVTKSGYETAGTMPPYPATTYNPVDINASVVVGSLNVANIVQNKLATLEVNTVNNSDSPIPDVDFHIKGGRKLGTEAIDPFPIVYNLDLNSKTDSGGVKDFNSVSPGQYFFSLLPAETKYVLIDTDPITPATIFSDQNVTLKAKLADKNVSSLLVKVVSKPDDITPVTGANVEVSNGSGIDINQATSATGTAFFPVGSDLLQPGTYNLKITANGFKENNSQVTIISNQLDTISISLETL